MTAKAFSLNGKKAIVVGENKLWTGVVVSALASAGADVAIVSKKSPKVDQLVEAVSKVGEKVVAFPIDVTSADQMKEAVQKTIKEFGKIDILVNASDVRFFAPFLEMNDADWQKAMEYNLNSVVYCCREVGR